MNAKAKGASGEREACAWLERYVWRHPIGLERNLNQVRSGGADIIQHPFVFEVKRRNGKQKLGLNGWWSQVNQATQQIMRDEETDTYLPVVMFRIDNGHWEFLVPANLLQAGLPGWLHMSRHTFIAWARKYLGL